MLAARRADVLEEVARDCRSTGTEAIVVPTDVTLEGIVERVLLDALRRWHLTDEPQWTGNGNLYVGARADQATTHGVRPPKIGLTAFIAWAAWRFVRNELESASRTLRRSRLKAA